jgi:hypothetical protein
MKSFRVLRGVILLFSGLLVFGLSAAQADTIAFPSVGDPMPADAAGVVAGDAIAFRLSITSPTGITQSFQDIRAIWEGGGESVTANIQYPFTLGLTFPQVTGDTKFAYLLEADTDRSDKITFQVVSSGGTSDTSFRITLNSDQDPGPGSNPAGVLETGFYQDITTLLIGSYFTDNLPTGYTYSVQVLVASDTAVVPIPPSVLLMGSGLMGLGLIGWRRRKS